MDRKEFWRKLTPPVFPIAFQQLMSALVSTSDTLMMGLFDQSSLSAVIAGTFPAGGDTRFGFICDCITLWLIVVPLGLLGAFVWDLPIWLVYIFINMDEWVKIPAVFHHYRKYRWVRNLMVREEG